MSSFASGDTSDLKVNDMEWPSVSLSSSPIEKLATPQKASSPVNAPFTSFAAVLGNKGAPQTTSKSLPLVDSEPLVMYKGKKKKLVYMMGGNMRGAKDLAGSSEKRD
jgi:hypothetical protein